MNSKYGAGHGSAPSRHKKQGSKGAGVNEKPGMPGADLPGKPQSRSRSNGVKACKTYANSKGLGQ